MAQTRPVASDPRAIEMPAALRRDVRLLSTILGRVLAETASSPSP